MRFRVVLLLPLFAVVGCQSIKADLPRVPRYVYDSPDALPAYRVQPGDVLESHYTTDPTLNEQTTVAPDGRVSFLYASDTLAAGHTLAELTADVVKTAGIKDPHFAVVLRNSVGTRVYVTGEVTTPGEIIAPGQISAVQAVSRAGGFKLTAQSGEVVLMRRDPTNKTKLYRVDLDAAMDGSDPDEDVVLQPYDIVYVPRDRGGNVSLIFERIRNAIPTSASFVYGSSNAVL